MKKFKLLTLVGITSIALAAAGSAAAVATTKLGCVLRAGRVLCPIAGDGVGVLLCSDVK